MGYPDLIHVMKSPHWWVWLLTEAVLVLTAFLIGRFVPSVPGLVPTFLILAAILLFSFLSRGIAFSARIRETMVRPEALIEKRHVAFLVLGGVLGLLWALLLAVGTFNTITHA